MREEFNRAVFEISCLIRSISIFQVQELQKLDGQVRDQVNLAIQYAEKLISGKMSKQQYIEYESNVKGKRDDICRKIDSLLNTL